MFQFETFYMYLLKIMTSTRRIFGKVLLHCYLLIVDLTVKLTYELNCYLKINDLVCIIIYRHLKYLMLRVTESYILKTRGGRIKTLIVLSEPYQRCSRSSARIKHIDSGLVVYQRLFPFSRSE